MNLPSLWLRMCVPLWHAMRLSNSYNISNAAAGECFLGWFLTGERKVMQRLSFHEPGVEGSFPFEPRSCVCWWAEAPPTPRWECNYNVLRFLTSCVWVMGWNLNNLSFTYLHSREYPSRRQGRRGEYLLEEAESSSRPLLTLFEENVVGFCSDLFLFALQTKTSFYSRTEIYR